MTEKQRSLYMTSEVATQLHEEKKQAERERLETRLKVDEERIISRRAKQEQQLAYRSGIKQNFTDAKHSEDLVSTHCTDLEEALRLKHDAKQKIEKAQEMVVIYERDVVKAEKNIQTAQKKLDDAVSHLLVSDQNLKSMETHVDISIINLKKRRLQDSFNKSDKAWDKVQKAIRKRRRDRTLKKRAKTLLER